MTGRVPEKEKTITFHELGEVHSAERGSTSLTRLPDQFYERSATYLKSLLTEMENCTSEGNKEPDERYMRISEEYRRSKDILERIYSTRERKIVLAALNSSRGINQSTDEMIHEEEELYFSLKVELEDIRERILRYDRMHKKPAVLRAETGINTSTDDFVESDSKDNSGPTKAPMMDKALSELEGIAKKTGPDENRIGVTEPSTKVIASSPSKEKGEIVKVAPEDIVVVRAVKEVEPFVGPDNKTIQMAKEDIISLPGQVAMILIEGGMVQVVEEAE